MPDPSQDNGGRTPKISLSLSLVDYGFTGIDNSLPAVNYLIFHRKKNVWRVLQPG